jgi:hypothetical protein
MIKRLTPFNLIVLITFVFVFVVIGSCKKEILITEQAPKNFVREVSKTNVETIPFDEVQKLLVKDIPGVREVGFDKLLNSNSISTITDEEDNELVITTDSVKKISNANYTSFVFTLKLKSPRAVVFRNLTISTSKNGDVRAFVTTYKPDSEWIDAFRSGKRIPFSGTFKNSKLKGDWKKLNMKGSGNAIKELSLDCVDLISYSYYPYKCASAQHNPGQSGCQLMGDERAGYVVLTTTQTNCTWVNTPTQPGSGGSTNPPTTPVPPPPYNPCDELSVSSLPEDGTPPDPNDPTPLPCDESSLIAEENLVAELIEKPDLLLDCLTAKWFKTLASYVPPQSVFDRISALNSTSSSKPLFTNPFYVQQIKNAGGYVINLDRLR